ncbi:MAG: putative toxin-antitoxin system toxin component, PIN family [Anaerolineales bacterium]
MRAVLDTNVFVSMLISRRDTEAWLTYLWKNRYFEVVVSQTLLDELMDVLNRSHVTAKIDLHRRIALFQRFRHRAFWTPGSLDTAGTMPDPNDDFLVSAALETKASFIVTWDKALLEQGEARGVQIVTPNAFISTIIRG